MQSLNLPRENCSLQQKTWGTADICPIWLLHPEFSSQMTTTIHYAWGAIIISPCTLRYQLNSCRMYGKTVQIGLIMTLTQVEAWTYFLGRHTQHPLGIVAYRSPYRWISRRCIVHWREIVDASQYCEHSHKLSQGFPTCVLAIIFYRIVHPHIQSIIFLMNLHTCIQTEKGCLLP